MKSVLHVVLGATLALALSVTGNLLAQGRPPAPAPHQQPPRTSQPTQQPPAAQTPLRTQQMEQLRTMTQDSARIRTRAEQLARTCAEDQTRLRNQTQLRMMQDMSNAVGAAAREHEQMAQRLQDLVQERDRDRDLDRDRDRDMDRDMDRIRKHLDTMTKSMNDTLTLMEQMHDRLRTSDSSSR